MWGAVVLRLGAGIENSHPVGAFRELLGVAEVHVAAQQVGADGARHVHGVFRTVRRGVGKFQVLQVVNRHPGAQRDCKYVDALVDTVPAEHLPRPEKLAGRAVGEEHLQEQGCGAGVVRRMAVLVGVDLAVFHSARLRSSVSVMPVPPAVISNTLTTAVRLRATVRTAAAGDRLRRDPALPVGRARQHRRAPVGPVTEVGGLHRITGGEDVGR